MMCVVIREVPIIYIEDWSNEEPKTFVLFVDETEFEFFCHKKKTRVVSVSMPLSSKLVLDGLL